MKNQKSTFKLSEIKPLRTALYRYYNLATLQDYADLMYKKKSDGFNQDVSFMASLLNKDEAKFVLEYLESFLFSQDMDHQLTSDTIAHDFRLEQHEEEFDQNYLMILIPTFTFYKKPLLGLFICRDFLFYSSNNGLRF